MRDIYVATYPLLTVSFVKVAKILPDGMILAPMYINHTTYIVCEVEDGATARWQLGSRQITDHIGITSATDGNISTITITDQGIYPYMGQGLSSGILNITCLTIYNDMERLGRTRTASAIIVYYGEYHL